MLIQAHSLWVAASITPCCRYFPSIH